MTEEFDLDRLAEAMRSQTSQQKAIWNTDTCILRLRARSAINLNTLVHAIEKYNNEIKQGFAIGEILKYDYVFLEQAVAYYNNLIRNQQ